MKHATVSGMYYTVNATSYHLSMFASCFGGTTMMKRCTCFKYVHGSYILQCHHMYLHENYTIRKI